MNSIELVHTFIENANARGIDHAKSELARQSDFLVIDSEDLELAIVHSVREARGNAAERNGYLLVILIALAAFLLNGYVLATSAELTGLVRYALCGVASGAAVLVFQYFKYLRDLDKKSRITGDICRELKLALRQHSKAG